MFIPLEAVPQMESVWRFMSDLYNAYGTEAVVRCCKILKMCPTIFGTLSIKGLRRNITFRRLLVETQLGAWLGLGNQPLYGAPDEPRIKIRLIRSD